MRLYLNNIYTSSAWVCVYAKKLRYVELGGEVFIAICDVESSCYWKWRYLWGLGGA